MKLDSVLRLYGGKDKDVPTTAHALGLTPACVYGWDYKGYIPYKSQILVELHSGGKLKANKSHGKKVVKND